MEEEAVRIYIAICRLHNRIKSDRLFESSVRNHLNFAKIQQHFQADQLLDLFHFSDALVTVSHYLVRADFLKVSK